MLLRGGYLSRLSSLFREHILGEPMLKILLKGMLEVLLKGMLEVLLKVC